MSGARELEDYAETVVLPEGHLPPAPDAQRAAPITADELDRVLAAQQGSQTTAARSAADAALEAACNPAAAEAHARYAEYLRMLDELPVLSDVVREPPKVRIRDFRRGERPDARKHAREDAYTLRERHAHDLEQRYREYAETLAGGERAARGAGKSPRKKGRAARPKGAKRSKRRKS